MFNGRFNLAANERVMNCLDTEDFLLTDISLTDLCYVLALDDDVDRTYGAITGSA